LEDDWEVQYGLDPSVGAAPTEGGYGDYDRDGISNYAEYLAGLDPSLVDSDADGYSDWEEINLFNSDPLVASILGDVDPIVPSWKITDWNTYVAGSGFIAKEDSRLLTLIASGSGLLNEGSEQATFFHRTITGDFSVTFKSLADEEPFGSRELAIVARAEIDTDSPYVAIISRPNRNRYAFTYRDGSGQNDVLINQNFVSSIDSNWLRLVRNGNTLRSYASDDGIGWQFVGERTVPMAIDIEVGLALASANSHRITVAKVYLEEWKTDADGDGIWDSEEAGFGTSSGEADSDSDGCTDYEEIYEFFSDPLLSDLAPATSVFQLNGAEEDASVGDWFTDDGAIYAADGRGFLEYTINLSEDSIYRLNVYGENRFNSTGISDYNLKVYIDDVYIGRISLLEKNESMDVGRILTPWLRAGTHKVNLFLDNTYSKRSLQINSLSVEYIGGDDLDQDGVADWMKNRLSALNGLSHNSDDGPIESLVSPYCLTGYSRFSPFSSVTSHPNSEIKALPAFDFFADISLEAGSITDVFVDFENGGHFGEVEASWLPTNLFEHDSLTVRSGDSILISAFTGQQATGDMVVIELADGSTITTTDDQPIEVLFDEPGLFEFTAQTLSGEASLEVEVLEATLGEAISLRVNRARNWMPDALSGNVSFINDEMITLNEVTPSVSSPREFDVRALTNEPVVIAAQLPENGAFLDSLLLTPFLLSSDDETNIQVIDTFEDGDQLIKTTITLDYVPEDIVVEVDIRVSGVTFADGSILKTFRAADFDELGRVELYFIRPAESRTSVCHRITVSFE
ncbi:MAG: hypothetical protein AAGH40_05645, partial [Verrucomicrobiota bacterium]